MKNIITVVFLLISSSLLANNALQLANNFYKNAQYEQAIAAYTKMISNDEESPELFYNLGNAYYKNNEIGKAILFYEKTLLIQPNFSDARFNLELAQAKTVDKIDKKDSFFLIRWFDGFTNIMSSNAWAILSVLVFISFLILVFIYAFSKLLVIRKVSFYTAVFFLLISFTGMVMAKRQKDKVEKREYAIIMAPSVTAKSAPAESGTSIFVLHEGTKVKIISNLDSWAEIELEDGNVGWILISDLERI